MGTTGSSDGSTGVTGATGASGTGPTGPTTGASAAGSTGPTGTSAQQVGFNSGSTIVSTTVDFIGQGEAGASDVLDFWFRLLVH